MNRKAVLSILMAFFVLIKFMTIPSLGEEKEKQAEALTLNAQSAVLIDADSGRILYGKNEDVKRPMASTTKIMTCILALENGKLQDVVTASKKAASQPQVHLSVREGEQFKLEDLLYSLMLESHNDTAVMIAEHIGKSTEGFAAMMNEKAGEIGCENTYFITPNGLDAKIGEGEDEKIHSTTAADLAQIMRYCIMESPKKEEFLKITSTQNYYFTDNSGKRSFNCVNHNALLTMMDGALSGKTGFTGQAGYSYVGAAQSEGRTFIIALLGCGWPPHKTYKWSDARVLFRYGMENYAYRDIFREPVFEPFSVKNGIPETGFLENMPECGMSLLLGPEEKSLSVLLREEEEAEISYKIPKQLEAPVKKGQQVGTITYSLEGKELRVYPVYACEDIERIDFLWCVKKVAFALLTGNTNMEF